MEKDTSANYEPGTALEISVERIVPGGYGIGFAQDLTIFVPLSAPGDRLRVRLETVKGKTAFAEIESIIEKSAERSIPPCKYFGTCGGCDMQQLPYSGQLSSKADIVRDALHRIGKLEIGEIPIIPSPKPLAYRTRALWRADTREGKMGYYKRNSHDIVDVDHCPILDPSLDETLQKFRSDLSEMVSWEEKLVVEAVVGSDGRVSIYSADSPDPTSGIQVEAAGEKFTFDARTFFQGNLSLVETLIELAVRNTSGEYALDLYCGVGLFSLPLARRFRQVIGVESNARAIDFANTNAKNAGLGNLRFIAEGAARFLFDRDPGGPDLVLLDPPRAGTEKNVVKRIIGLGPREISYVACDPAILARDLRRLVDGGYSIDSVTALDLFPQTHHIETVARLSRA